MRKRIIACLLVISTAAVAQEIDVDAIDLNDLMNMKIKVASMKALPAVESPGIITVISGDEIRSSGARDLTDILETVPGFDFGVDVEGVTGVGIRGNWAHEGKVLLMIDGQVMNEGLYSTLQFGNHYPVNDISRIEIMRGPGSVIYGDYAEYAVINIITQQADEIGVRAGAVFGMMQESFSKRGASIAAGKSFKKIKANIKGSYFEGNRSDESYTDVNGNTFDMTNRSSLDNAWLNGGFSAGNFSVRAIADIYNVTSADEYETVADNAYLHEFKSYFAEVKHVLEVSTKINIENRINYKFSNPWKSEGDEDNHPPFDINNNRYTFNSTGSFDVLPELNITAGVEGLHDRSTRKIEGELFSGNESRHLSYSNAALFGQFLWKNKIITLIAGGRQNFHSGYESSFVPRLGITRTIGRFHAKALYSKSYRSPVAMNIDLSNNIEPEITTVMEVETGFKISRHLSVTVNAFDIETRNSIIYIYESTEENEGYINEDISGTQGIESELHYCFKRYSARVGYSYYTAANTASLDEYSIPGNSERLLALPNHKGYASITIPLSSKLSIASQAIFSGKRTWINGINNGDALYHTAKTGARMNAVLTLKDIVQKGLTVSGGVYNITDANEYYAQPYNSMHAPLPGTGREYRIQLNYELKSNSHSSE